MELGFIKDMFDNIAPHYDFLNRLLSLRRDVLWRRQMAEALCLGQGSLVLDAACGTGDVMIEVLRSAQGVKHVYGLDFAPRMLKIAEHKLGKTGKSGQASLVAGSCLALPFQAGSFDAVTIAFGIRNIMDRRAVLREFRQHLKPGGRMAVLELSTPASPFFRSLYLFYFEKILPRIGGFFSRNRMAYRYLPASVIKFPEPETFACLMRSAGFENIKWRRLTLGLASLHIGVKP